MLDRRLVYSRFRPGHVLRDEGSLLTSTTFARGYELLLVGCSGGELRAHDAYSGEAVDEVADAHSGPVVMLQVGGRGWGGSEAGRLGGWGGLGVWSPPRAAQGRVQPAGRCVNAVAHPRPPRPRPQTHELPGAPADELLLLSSSRHEAKLWRGADLATSSAHEFPGLTRARFNPAGTQVRPRRLMPVCSWARRPPRAEQRHSEPPDSVNSPDPNPVPPPTQPPSPRAQIVGVSSLPPRRALIYDAATGAALAELDDAALARGAGQGGADRGRGAAAACFSPTGELLLWGTTLWDPRVPVAVHTFDQLSEHQVGGPGAREAREVLGRPGASPSANQAPAQQRLGTAAPLPLTPPPHPAPPSHRRAAGCGLRLPPRRPRAHPQQRGVGPAHVQAHALGALPRCDLHYLQLRCAGAPGPLGAGRAGRRRVLLGLLLLLLGAQASALAKPAPWARDPASRMRPPLPPRTPLPPPQPPPTPGGDVIFARLRRPSDDSLAALLHPRRRRHPLATAFRTVDGRTYSEIATVDVERAVLDLALDPSDSYLAVVAVDIAADTTAVSSSVRTFEVGRPRPSADDESDEGDDAEDEDEEEVRRRGALGGLAG
jgi:hypothetical protein